MGNAANVGSRVAHDMKLSRTETWYLKEPQGVVWSALLLACHRIAGANVVALSLSRGALQTALPSALNEYSLSLDKVRNRFGNAGVGTVARIRLSARSTLAIAAQARGIFGWALPDLPEDLALLRGEELILGSVTHEQLCWLQTTKDIFSRMLEVVPGLEIQSGPGFRGQ